MLLLALLVTCVGVHRVSAYIEPIALPRVLEECYGEHTRFVNITEVPSQSIVSICVYNLNAEKMNEELEMTKDAERYMESLLRKVVGNEMTNRKKRNVFIRDVVTERREIRMYSEMEWRKFVGRLNDLKRSTDVRPNRYDAIAEFHQGATIPRAHKGPAFLPWHRIYLLALEAALEMPIPYWNSTIDFYMRDPSQSVIFTHERLGNGCGEVVTGPFANWGIRRDIGGDGSLISAPMLRNVLSRKYQSEISEGTRRTNPLFSVEAIHDSVHNWVGGNMAELMTASYDPVFFMVHAFVDYIWDIFNLQQRKRNIDTYRDYPSTRVHGQRSGDRMVVFRSLKNRDGQRDYYAEITDYIDLPPCPACGMLFGMECIHGHCVAVEPHVFEDKYDRIGNGDHRGFQDDEPRRPMPFRTLEEFTRPDQDVEFFESGELRDSGNAFQSHFVDARTRQGSRRGKRFANDNISDFPPRELTSKERNNFLINGVADHNEWVYLNIKVNYHRLNFNNSIEFQPAKLERCARTPPDGAKVWVQSDGINYLGRYKDYVAFQNDQVMTRKVMIGIKKPDNTSTEVYITAHDTCGRACLLDCSTFEQFKCPGAFKITQDFPLLYSTIDAAKDLESPIIFDCSFKLQWPWV